MYLCAEVYHIPFTEWLKWDEGDRQKALAWEIRKRQTCQHCGTKPEDWQAGKRIYAPKQVPCIGCKELVRANKSVPQSAREWIRVALVRIGGKHHGKRSS